MAAQIARDPRFGRNSELPGECPFLNGEYATHYVAGMQQPDPHGHPLMLAYLKHFDACEYSNGLPQRARLMQAVAAIRLDGEHRCGSGPRQLQHLDV